MLWLISWVSQGLIRSDVFIWEWCFMWLVYSLVFLYRKVCYIVMVMFPYKPRAVNNYSKDIRHSVSEKDAYSEGFMRMVLNVASIFLSRYAILLWWWLFISQYRAVNYYSKNIRNSVSENHAYSEGFMWMVLNVASL